MSNNEPMKNISGQINEQLHKKLKVKLILEEKSFKDWLNDVVQEYTKDLSL